MEVSKPAVGSWRAGEKKPGLELRRKIETHYAIPAASWDNAPGVRVPPPDEVPPEPAPAPRLVHRPETAAKYDPNDPYRDVDELISECRKGMKLGGLLPAEKATWQERLLKAIQARHKIQEGQDVREDKIVRQNAQWARIKQAMADALAPFPDAAEAVAVALRALDGAE